MNSAELGEQLAAFRADSADVARLLPEPAGARNAIAAKNLPAWRRRFASSGSSCSTSPPHGLARRLQPKQKKSRVL